MEHSLRSAAHGNVMDNAVHVKFILSCRNNNNILYTIGVCIIYTEKGSSGSDIWVKVL